MLANSCIRACTFVVLSGDIVPIWMALRIVFILGGPFFVNLVKTSLCVVDGVNGGTSSGVCSSVGDEFSVVTCCTSVYLLQVEKRGGVEKHVQIGMNTVVGRDGVDRI